MRDDELRDDELFENAQDRVFREVGLNAGTVFKALEPFADRILLVFVRHWFCVVYFCDKLNPNQVRQLSFSLYGVMMNFSNVSRVRETSTRDFCWYLDELFQSQTQITQISETRWLGLLTCDLRTHGFYAVNDFDKARLIAEMSKEEWLVRFCN